MRYALLTIWFDWRRYLMGVLAVAFSNVLIILQFGIMIGLISMVSRPVDMACADIWVASPNTPSCDLGLPIARHWINRLEQEPAVSATDEFIQTFMFWTSQAEGNILCVILGCNLHENTLGPGRQLTREQRLLLSEVGTVLLDHKDRARLGIERVGQIGEIAGRRVRVVGFLADLGSMTGPYVICSLQTARQMLGVVGYDPHTTTYLLATCQDPGQVAGVLSRLRRFPHISAYAAEDFSRKSRWYWLVTSRSGIAVGFMSALGLLVGAVVTSQSLYSAIVVTRKELALLRALGAGRGRVRMFVIQQALVVGIAGVGVGMPLAMGLSVLARTLGTRALVPSWLVAAAALVTLAMALLAGLAALRSLKHTEPEQLLR